MKTIKTQKNMCFNPCFNGTYSLTLFEKFGGGENSNVLILVLMELTL